MQSELLKNIWTEFGKETLKIYVVNVKEISCRDLRAAYLLMSDSRRSKCDGLKTEDDKKRCITADRLLREVLSEFTGKKPDYFVFKETETGKPYCTNADVYFSISHSGDYVAVAVSASCEVGVDIEKLRHVKAAVMRMFCNERDCEFIRGSSDVNELLLTEPDVLERFFRVWTFKEAAVKLTGEGITDRIKRVEYDEKACFSVCFDGYCLTAVSVNSK